MKKRYLLIFPVFFICFILAFSAPRDLPDLSGQNTASFPAMISYRIYYAVDETCILEADINYDLHEGKDITQEAREIIQEMAAARQISLPDDFEDDIQISTR